MATSRSAQESKLVSVICRTIGRSSLRQALQSVADQTYTPVEIVLVDAAASDALDPAAIPDSIPVVHVKPASPLARAAAANAGLDAAHGDYLMFLDDDDWIAAGHIEQLVAALSAIDDCRAAYSSVCYTTESGTETDTVFSRDYDPVLLRRDNYIPIHAVLFHRSLIAEGCRFDESFEIYEDWDFWIQVSRLTALKHLATISAFYRSGGSSETTVDDHSVRFQNGHPVFIARQKIYEKWKHFWSGAEINELIGSLDATDDLIAAEQRAAELHEDVLETKKLAEEQRTQLAAQQEDLTKSHLELQQHKQQEKQLLGQLEYVKQNANWRINELQSELTATKREFQLTRLRQEQHIAIVENRLNAIYSLPSWRLMGPFRRVRRLADKLILNSLRKKIHYHRYGTEWTPQDAATLTAVVADTAPAADATPLANEVLKSSYRERANENMRAFLDGGLGIELSNPDKPKVSILLVLYNQAPLTLLCLESIAQFAPAYCEIVIVDNASSDESGKMLEQIKNAKIIRNADNAGFVRAVNQGAEICRGDYLLLLNNDALLHPGSIESALRTFEEEPQAGAVGGKILLLDGFLQEAGSIIFDDGGCLGYGRKQPADLPEFMFRRRVDYCSGAFLLTPLALFREMGGFDDDYAPAYYEESDYCIRLQKRGLHVFYDPDAVITHFEFASSGGLKKASELQTKHRAILVQKHEDFLYTKYRASNGVSLRARSAGKSPNILIIDDCVPHASLGSGYPRCREIVHALAATNANLSFYPLQFPQENWSAVYTTLPRNVEVLLNHGRDKLGSFLQARAGYYDYIIVSRIHNMQMFSASASECPEVLKGTKIVYDAEAVTAPREILYRELQGEVVDSDEKSRLLKDEIQLAEMADAVLCVSENEASIYHQHGFRNTYVLGHSLTATEFAHGVQGRSGLLFVGALRDENSPNVDSLHWFVRHCLPEIQTRIAAVHLHIVGDSSAPSLADIKDPGITFHGRQESLARFYGQSRVFLAPTRFAAGIPHKVHEAAANGIPCVVTSLLAKQLGWKDGVELLIADTASQFAHTVCRLLTDDELWENIQSAALARVKLDCSPEIFRSVLLKSVGLETD